MDDGIIIAIVAVACVFVVFPALVLHYITLWRRQKTLEPSDERMLEDLWRSAKAMERRIETLESLVERDTERRPRRDRADDDDENWRN
ncbi:MAG: envelope stress response membrane protein PspB [Pseudomonadota bacterium]